MSTAAPRRKGSRHTIQASVWDVAAGLSVSPELFSKFQRLIHEETGIWLGESKAPLLCGRLLPRLRSLGIAGLDQYYELVVGPDQGEERTAMIDAITTNETRFFREPQHFEFLEQKVIPLWRAEADRGLRSRAVRIWSAGCSSGEESYSLAMLLEANLPRHQGWKASILATDISSRMLDRARDGIYDVAKSKDIPERLLRQYMLKGIAEQKGLMQVMPWLRAAVEFGKLNLSHGPYPADGQFDAILCRNVLIYFNLEAKSKVVERLTRCLAPNGLLFLGHAESLSGLNLPLRSLAPAVYVRIGEQGGL